MGPQFRQTVQQVQKKLELLASSEEKGSQTSKDFWDMVSRRVYGRGYIQLVADVWTWGW
jgi:hypothetical protein